MLIGCINYFVCNLHSNLYLLVCLSVRACVRACVFVLFMCDNFWIWHVIAAIIICREIFHFAFLTINFFDLWFCKCLPIEIYTSSDCLHNCIFVQPIESIVSKLEWSGQSIRVESNVVEWSHRKVFIFQIFIVHLEWTTIFSVIDRFDRLEPNDDRCSRNCCYFVILI